MSAKNLWEQQRLANPGHSAWYISRFQEMRAEGRDLHGEARLVDAMLPRKSRILDAGCGPGRVGGELARHGHDVVGVDLDDELIAAAQQDHPMVDWRVGDLAELDLPQHRFDLIVCAGNVMTFLAPGTASGVLTRYRAHLADNGRIVVGFGTNRGYEREQFSEDVIAAGLVETNAFSTWDLRPFTAESDFLVSFLEPAARY